MSAWLDPLTLPLLLAAPLLGALFVWMMPSSDRVTLRHVGFGAMLLNIAVALRAGHLLLTQSSDLVPLVAEQVLFFRWPLQLELTQLPWLVAMQIVFPISLRAGASRIAERMQSYVAFMLLAQACINGALLSAHPISAWALMALSTFPVGYVLGAFGGNRKRSSALTFVVLHGVFDAGSLLALAYMLAQVDSPAQLAAYARSLDDTTAVLLFVPLAASGLARALIAPLSSSSRAVCDQAPVSVAGIVFGALPLMGLSFVVDHAVFLLPQAVLVVHPVVLGAAGASIVLGGFGALVDRDLRRYALGVCRFGFAVCAVGALSLHPDAMALSASASSLLAVCVVAYLVVIDSIERRYVTRDGTELVGMAEQLPGLWRLQLVTTLALLGLPVVGAGVFWLDLLPLLGHSVLPQTTGLPANLSMLVPLLTCFAFVLVTSGATRHIRRTSTFPLRATAALPSGLTPGQAMRLWLPLAGALVLHLLLWQHGARVASQWRVQLSTAQEQAHDTAAVRKWRKHMPMAPAEATASSSPTDGNAGGTS